MSKRLVSLHGNEGWFSPLVDVALNGMMAMFVFLIVYMAVIPPSPQPTELRIETANLPVAVWYKGYEAAISVSGGAGAYMFSISPEDALSSVSLNIDLTCGRISGTPRPPAPEARHSVMTRRFRVVVRDQVDQRVEADLDLRIVPVAIPFDPEHNPLRFAASDFALPVAWIGRRYTYSLAIVGGIEDYEFELDARLLPPGLSFSRGTISGTPLQSSVPDGEAYKDYVIPIAVKDQQTAYLPFTANAEPMLRENLRLRVRRLLPIEIHPMLPPARAGQSYLGVISAWGGSGRLRWAVLGDDLIQRMLDKATGRLRGQIGVELTPANRPVSRSFRVRVEDEDDLVPAVEQEVILKILPPMHFVSQQETL